MHYKNGRPAQNGDKVLLLHSYGAPVVGILYDAVSNNDRCNGRLAPCSPSDPMPNLSECLHIDDVKAADFANLIGDSRCPMPIIPANGDIPAPGTILRGSPFPGQVQTVGTVTFNATTEVKPNAS